MGKFPNYHNFFTRLRAKLTSRIANIYDWWNDRKICGMSLVKTIETPYGDSHGATRSQPTHYWVLDQIFEGAPDFSGEKFIDVGCGQGRVLAYFLKKGFLCELYGVELNEAVASRGRQWAARYDNVHIVSGDAFSLNYDEFTILYLFRPFLDEIFFRFVQKLEGDLTHPLRLIYYADQQNGDYLANRPGWQLRRRGWINRYKGINISFYPQRYSLWVYKPVSLAN